MMHKSLAVFTIVVLLLCACDSADIAGETALKLENAVPPVRDDLRLAIAYKGLEDPILPTPPPVTQPRKIGEHESFWVHDLTHNTFSEIEAELLAVGDHAYFWFETGENEVIPDDESLSAVALGFDAAYESVVEQFGQEANPGIDGDPRLYVLHASQQAMCGSGSCWFRGFFDSTNSKPLLLNAHSNEHEMFIMANNAFVQGIYLLTLTHEFRHMIESNYDLAETGWGKEGSAVLAEEFAGRSTNHNWLANHFLAEPDQQLNDWKVPTTDAYYAQFFLFNKYLLDQLGEDLYREFATSPLPGFSALNQIAKDYDLAFTGKSLWLDWLAALLLTNNSQASEQYRINIDGLRLPRRTPIEADTGKLDLEVHQFGADYYQLPTAKIEIVFEGSPLIALLAGQEASDEIIWYAQRANYSNPRLTRSLDLSEVHSATLTFDVYSDIEKGWDFAYVSASIDGGTTWEPLTADNMQGLEPEDDPAGIALASRFYTGRDQTWRPESISLTPYAGQKILLRFEVVTDDMLTHSGLAIDNVAVPEIDYTDNESGDGWTAEGFTLASASLQQPWHLQLIEYTADGPVVKQIAVKDDGTAKFTSIGEVGQEQPVLIVAASAPMTLVPATYTLEISE